MTTHAPEWSTPAVAEYLARIEQLYADVQRWMAAAEPRAAFGRSTVDLDEQATGPYIAPVLEVARPAGAFRLVPRARYMLGASGLVDVRSRLGSEMLVWVAAGAPAIGFKFPNGSPPVEVVGEPTQPDLVEGWAWADDRRADLVHLDRDVFLNEVVETLS